MLILVIGGVNTVYVMPNLVPPLTSASDAMAYKQRLREVDSSVNYLMTLYERTCFLSLVTPSSPISFIRL